MNWQQVIDSPHLKDIPFKVELEKGKVILTPTNNMHGALKARMASYIHEQKHEQGGKIIMNCAIENEDKSGVIVADVAWISDEAIKMTRELVGERDGIVTPLPFAPEICVDIDCLDPAEDRVNFYLSWGAKDVYVVKSHGKSAGQFDLYSRRRGKDLLRSSMQKGVDSLEDGKGIIADDSFFDGIAGKDRFE